jgi:hypothetical protein
MLIEEGWRVISVEGDHLGHVTAVDAELERDIFDGIEYRHLVFEHARYVPSEQVSVIFEGEVRLTITADEAERLPPAR